MTYPKNENFIKHGIYSVDDLKKDYYRKTKGHWFDAGSMRFFNCRLGTVVYPGHSIIYFVSSEKFDHASPRLYTLRSYDPATGAIDTVGDFQGYKAAASAARDAIRLLVNEDKQDEAV